MKEFVIYRPDILKRVAFFGLVGFVVLVGFSIRAHYVFLANNFNGRVDSIKYGEKGNAFIIIKRKEYILDGAWSYSPNNRIFIQKGDSMVKYKDSTTIKLIRPNGVTVTHSLIRMTIEVIEVETKLHVLAMNFGNTYFSCMYDHYKIVFTNSIIVEEMETLHVLSTKLDKKKPSTIISKDRALLDSILESYTYLITVYKTLANISMLSPKYKRQEMVKYLHDWCKASAGSDVKALVAEVVKEMIDPEKIPDNLSRQERVKLLAEQMSAANKENLYKKVPKR